MAIVYQSDKGLNEGISSAGNYLGQALMQAGEQRQQQRQQQGIASIIQEGGINEGTLAKILAAPGGSAFLQQIGPTLAILLKEQARSGGADNFLSGIFNQGQPSQPTLSPIQEAEQAQSNNSSISGVPGVPGQADSNRAGPLEQTLYQQGGNQAEGVNPPEETSTPGAKGLKDFSKLTDNALVNLAASPYKEHQNAAKAEQDRRAEDNKRVAAREERAYEGNKEFIKEVNKVRSSFPEKEIALSRIEDAIQSGDVNRFTDWAADVLGFEPGKGNAAQIMQSAVKELFLADLKTLPGGRINQLIEGNLLKALPGLGKSEAANQEITETLYTIKDIEKERVRLFDEMDDLYESQGKELPRTAQKQVEKKLAPFVTKKINELNKTRSELKEGKVKTNAAVKFRKAQRTASESPPPEGTQWVLSPEGAIKAVPDAEVEKWTSKEVGGRLLNEQ